MPDEPYSLVPTYTEGGLTALHAILGRIYKSHWRTQEGWSRLHPPSKLGEGEGGMHESATYAYQITTTCKHFESLLIHIASAASPSPFTLTIKTVITIQAREYIKMKTIAMSCRTNRSNREAVFLFLFIPC